MSALSLFRQRPAPLAEIDEIETYVEAFEVSAGTIVMKQGEPAGGFFFVLSGEFAVLYETGVRPVLLGTMGPGSCFGETGLLVTGTHTATVRAVTDAEVAVRGENQLRSILADAVVTGVDLPTAAAAFVSLLDWGAELS